MSRGSWRCPIDGKSVFTTWKRAARSARNMKEDTYIYWCPDVGGYHITRLGPGEYDRRQAMKNRRFH